MKCSNCHKDFPDDYLYCPWCGTSIKAATPHREGQSVHYCGITGKEITGDYRIIKHKEIVSVKSKTWGYFNQFTETATEGYWEYYTVDPKEFKRINSIWRFKMAWILAFPLAIGSLFLLDNDLLNTINDLYFGKYGDNTIDMILIFVFAFVFFYFLYTVFLGFVFGFIAYPNHFHEKAKVTYIEAEEYVLKKHPEISKEMDKLTEHGFYEEAQDLVREKL